MTIEIQTFQNKACGVLSGSVLFAYDAYTGFQARMDLVRSAFIYCFMIYIWCMNRIFITLRTIPLGLILTDKGKQYSKTLMKSLFDFPLLSPTPFNYATVSGITKLRFIMAY